MTLEVVPDATEPDGAGLGTALGERARSRPETICLSPLLERIQRGEIDPTFVITHRLPLAQAPHGYEIFNQKRDDCEKIVLTA